MRYAIQILVIILIGLNLALYGCYAIGTMCIALAGSDECESYYTRRRTHSSYTGHYYGGHMYYRDMYPPVTIHPGGR